MADGMNCVTPSIDPSRVNVVQRGLTTEGEEESGEEEDRNIEEDNGEDENIGDYIYSQYYRLENLERRENSFWHDFVHEVNNDGHGSNQALNQAFSNIPVPNEGYDGIEVPIHSHGGIEGSKRGRRNSTQASKQPPKNVTRTTTKSLNPIPMKRSRRQSTGSAKLSSQIDDLVTCCKTALDSEVSTPSSVNTQSFDSNVVAVSNVMKRLVANSGLLKGSDLYCHSFYLLEDVVRREMFLNMEDDDCRMAWLKYMHAMKEKQK